MSITHLCRAIGMATLLGAAATAATAAGSWQSTIVATGLDTPRGLAIGPDGAVYVAESGVPAADGPSVVIRGATFRYGESGAITRIANGTQQRVLDGLPTLGALSNGETSGPQDIAFDQFGTMHILFGLGADPAVRGNELGAAAGAATLGQIMRVTPGGLVSFADVAAYERSSNPAGGPFDSNPFRMVASGNGFIVGDAGANAFYRAEQDLVTLLAAIPPRNIGGGFPSDSVITSVAVGPDNAIYAAELTGFPFTPGAARIYRLEEGMLPEIFLTGFTMIADIAFGPDGSLFVLELDSNSIIIPGGSGQIIRVGPGGRRSLVRDGLVMPTGLAVDDGGRLFVSNFSAMTGIGQVLMISYIPEPATWGLMIAGFGAIGMVARRRRVRAFAA